MTPAAIAKATDELDSKLPARLGAQWLARKPPTRVAEQLPSSPK
jgi:hypothetical protein